MPLIWWARACRGLLVPDDSAVHYANYNSYGRSDAAWTVGATPEPFATVKQNREAQSQQLIPEFLMAEGQAPQLENHLDFAFGGLYGMPFGPSRPVLPKTSIRVVEEPSVHSVSATTANFTWMTAVPVEADISWGDTQAMTNTLEYLARPFATMSLTGLEPNTTYYFKINNVPIPEDIAIDAEPIPLGEMLTFTTLAADPEPTTYYVSTTGDDGNDGLGLGTAWRTLQHAADNVGVGDTVLIAGGRYSEEVYIKASGSPGRAITFKNIPGEKVEFFGVMAALSNAFIIAGKSHLNFDGLYFTEYGDSNPWTADFLPLVGADFNIYESSDITISRSFFYGYSFQLNGIMAHQVDSLSLDNVVFMNHFQALYMYYVSNLSVDHSVIARPWLFASIIYNLVPEQPARYNQSIITDNFKSKADQNLQFFYGDSGIQTQCVYSLRDEHDPTWRKLDAESTVFDAPDRYIDPIFADPQFAGVEALIAAGEDITFSADGVMSENFIPDFASFYATNPAVTSLEIGLQPSRFDANGVPN